MNLLDLIWCGFNMCHLILPKQLQFVSDIYFLLLSDDLEDIQSFKEDICVSKT